MLRLAGGRRASGGEQRYLPCCASQHALWTCLQRDQPCASSRGPLWTCLQRDPPCASSRGPLRTRSQRGSPPLALLLNTLCGHVCNAPSLALLLEGRCGHVRNALLLLSPLELLCGTRQLVVFLSDRECAAAACKARRNSIPQSASRRLVSILLHEVEKVLHVFFGPLSHLHSERAHELQGSSSSTTGQPVLVGTRSVRSRAARAGQGGAGQGRGGRPV